MRSRAEPSLSYLLTASEATESLTSPASTVSEIVQSHRAGHGPHLLVTMSLLYLDTLYMSTANVWTVGRSVSTAELHCSVCIALPCYLTTHSITIQPSSRKQSQAEPSPNLLAPSSRHDGDSSSPLSDSHIPAGRRLSNKLVSSISTLFQTI